MACTLTNGRIISAVLSADSSEFRKTAENIEKAKDGPPKELLAKIKEYIARPRNIHEKTRAASVDSPTSIIALILGECHASLTIQQHTQCHEYLSACLAIRDREEITKVLCRHKPDHFTRAIRDVVNSFEPIIRNVHEKVDLREHLTSIENTLTDLINTSKPKPNPVTISNIQTGNAQADWGPTETRAPSIEDYVGLLTKARQLVYNLIHDVLSKCPEVADQYRSYCKEAFKTFSSSQTHASQQPRRSRQERSSSADSFDSAVEELQIEVTNKNGDPEAFEPNPAENRTNDPAPSKSGEGSPSKTEWRQRRGAAGALSRNLQTVFSALPNETRARVLAVVDFHVKYLAELEELSLNRMQHILDDMLAQPQTEAANSLDNHGLAKSAATASISGPGMFLSRWQQLLDDTIVTPNAPGGQPRRGKDVKHALAQGKTVSSATKGAWDPEALTALVESGVPAPPEGERIVVEAMGAAFKSLAGDLVARMTVLGG